MKISNDVLLGGLAGFLIGLLALPIFQNLGYGLSLASGIGLAVALALITMAGVILAGILSRFLPIINQLARFVVVGGLNTLVDLGVLNIFIYLTGLAEGWPYIGFKSASFMVAVVNSYVWNKYWTFGSSSSEAKELVQFFAVSIVGFLINVGTAALVVNFGHFSGVTPAAAANIGALAGTILGLAWNFVGYKFFVFKR